ncbi:MAG TPA: hypothetical protein VFA45_13625 [Actinomycetes bacterium]|nr:hypothetical protein [Actinomycetes bacterium]
MVRQPATRATWVITARWGEPLTVTFMPIRHLLTDKEAAEVTAVFGLGQQEP